MERVKRSENLKLLPLAVLLIITPLLSTSLRFKYLYLIVNILIISVGAEAGLFSFFLHSEENRKPAAPSVHSLLPPKKSAIASDSDNAPTKPAKAVGESAVEPSIFFIKGSESEEEDDDDEETVEENNAEDHELYQKSEKFIGNFYKQLKMQREKSWNEIH